MNSDSKEIAQMYKHLTEPSQIKSFAQIIQNLPYYTLVLDGDLKIVYSNDIFLNDHSIEDISFYLRRRPGDFFHCENALEKGCGYSEHCIYCGIHKTISECREKKRIVSNNCNLTAKQSAGISSYEYKAYCSPLTVDGDEYYLLTLMDISDINRRQMMEKIFYHDIVNFLGSLQGLSEILSSLNKQSVLNEYLRCLNNVTDQLKEIIFFQRDLSEAENGTLSLNPRRTNSYKILQAVVESAGFYNNNQKVKIELEDNNCNIDFITDTGLLCRVLVNMIKNAVEAAPERIFVGCSSKKNRLCFSVNNDTTIPYEYRSYIFKPNFSTKDKGRGLGTYSMRLIGENYLKGKVYFTTGRNIGTTFYIDLPLNLKLKTK